MLTTLTSKGQVTLPKEILERLGLKAGTKVDLELFPDGTVKLRPDRTALSLMGILKRTGQRPVSLEEMEEGIAAFLGRKHGRKRL